MKKLGLVLGVNMTVACLMMQGCKATKPGQPVKGSAPAVQPVAVVEPAPAPVDAPAPVVVAPVVVEPVAVMPVKPLPPPAKPKPIAVAPVAPVASATYVVQRGDTLARISKRNNVKLNAILAANPGLKADHIRIGQKIAIPGVAEAAAPKVVSAASPKAAPAVAADVTAPAKTKASFKSYTGAKKDYTVRNGDTLGSIALSHGITIRALKELNGLKKDQVRVGQKLSVPAEKVVAAKAEKSAPAKVADPAPKTEKADAAAAKPVEEKPADVKPAEPKVEAAVPVAAETAQAPVAPAVPSAPAAGPTYTVKDGDDLVSVAIAWGVSPSQVMDLNDLKAGEAIKPGQVLKLPANAKQAVQ